MKLEIKKLPKISTLNKEEHSDRTKLADRNKAVQTEVVEMYSQKFGNRPLQHLYLKIITEYHARDNPAEENISKSSQINKLLETIKLSNNQVTFNNASAKRCYIFIYIYIHNEQTSV